MDRIKTRLGSTALAGAAAFLVACSDVGSEEVASVEQRVVAGDGEVAGAGVRGADRAAAGASQDRYIVVFKKGTIGKAKSRAVDNSVGALRASLRSQFGATPRRVYSNALEGMAVTLPERAARARLERDPNVAYIVPDEVVSLDAVQVIQDNLLWGLDRIDQREWGTVVETNDADPDLQYAYDGTGKGVHIYVIDTGLNLTHDEFAGRVLNGYDVVEDDFSPDDCQGHGTHVAGIAAGTTYGVAKEAFVHPVRVVDCGRTYALSDVLAGLDWVGANLQRPAVINMSLGGPANQAYNDAVAAIIAQGATVTVSAGNDYRADACTKSPASVPEALTVGATFVYDDLTGFTNVGPCVDLFAPGHYNLSAWIGADDANEVLSGTSQAAPHVAGVAALLLGQYPEMTPAQVHTAILAAATPDTLIGGEPFFDPNTQTVTYAPFPSDGTPNLNLYMGDINTVGRGALFLGDREAACFDGVEVIVRDVDLAGAGSVGITITSSVGDFEQITLTEVTPNSGEFSAVVNFAAGSPIWNNGVVQTAAGGVVTAAYQDANAGNGSPATIFGDISIDCTPPQLGGIHAADVFSTGANIAFDLSEYANVTVSYGTDCSNLSESTNPRGVSPDEALIDLRDLSEDTTYYYTLTAVDRAGNTAVYDNDGMCYAFTTAVEIYREDFETTSVSLPGSTWHTTTACNATLPGHSPSTILYAGLDAYCNYDVGLARDDVYTTPVISVDFDDNPTLSFKYMLDVGAGDHGDVELVIDGGTPIVIASSSFAIHEKGALNQVEHWREVALSLAEYGTGTADIQLRFVLSHDDVGNTQTGFSVDDIVVAGGGCKPEIHEAETMSHATGGTHPLGWNIWDNGYISFNKQFTGGQQYMVVTAEGAFGGGAWPHMSVRVNGTEVFAADVTTTEWTDYGFWFNAPSGNAEVRIYFTNDYYQNGEDRNLFIEKVIFPCHASAPSGGTLAAQFEYFSTWPTGYCARLVLTNNGTAATSSWQAVIDTGAGYTFSSWNPTFPNSTGFHTLNSVANVNSVIQPGQTVPVDQRPGFCAEFGTTPTPPDLVTLSASY